MDLTPEQQQELARFPAPLQALIAAELAAGNALVELGGGHPAPPVGACAKLARKVTTRARATGDGLSFYERSSSSHSGEFTDAQRFFFVLEPPNPPPPEPDMDALRRALEPKPDPLAQVAQRPAGSGLAAVPDAPAPARKRAPRPGRTLEATPAGKPPAADRAVVTTETPTGRTHVLHFRDRRLPHEVQFALEREIMTLFTVTLEEGRPKWRARANVNGATYDFELQFVAAQPSWNRYSLGIEVSWPAQPAPDHDYFRKTSASWIRLWTGELTPANPVAAGEVLTARYRSLAQAALDAEAPLGSVAAVQQAILAGLKCGGHYATSHKEGGTHIAWQTDRFVRSDHGDNPDHKSYTDEAAFLAMLRQFCNFEVTRHAGREQRSELDTWKLILRLLRPG